MVTIVAVWNTKARRFSCLAHSEGANPRSDPAKPGAFERPQPDDRMISPMRHVVNPSASFRISGPVTIMARMAEKVVC